MWTLVALTPLLLPLLTDLTAWVVGSIRQWTWYGFADSMRAPALRALLSIVFLPHAAFLALDAIARTLRRVYVTHRHLLEWTTSAQTARLMRRRSRSFAPWMQTIEAPILRWSWAARSSGGRRGCCRWRCRFWSHGSWRPWSPCASAA
ncbi:MAG: hypothetical protein H6644_15250 [Caldilineaceae bacterium]|nr:hypothetical protein [Caldilineaceae bacterium]